MHFTHPRKIKLATPALWARHDQQVRKARTVHAQKSLGSFLCPFRPERSPVLAGDHVECRGGHPLKTGGVDQHIDWVLDAIVDDAALVDLRDASGGRIDQMYIRTVERG